MDCVEQYPVAETYADGICEIEIEHGIFRCVFFSEHKVSHGRARVIVARITMPVSRVRESIEKAMGALNKKPVLLLM